VKIESDTDRKSFGPQIKPSLNATVPLIGAIETFIDGWNERCQPFVWTKTADQLIPSAKRGQGTSIA